MKMLRHPRAELRQVFDPGIIPALVETVSLAMSNGKASSSKDIAAYIALTIRNKDTHSQFVNETGTRVSLCFVSLVYDSRA